MVRLPMARSSRDPARHDLNTAGFAQAIAVRRSGGYDQPYCRPQAP